MFFKHLFNVCAHFICQGPGLQQNTNGRLFCRLIEAPIFMYGSEVWGIYDMPEIDKLHYKFCKYSLGVKPSTSN